jgi:hypothetical protein
VVTSIFSYVQEPSLPRSMAEFHLTERKRRVVKAQGGSLFRTDVPSSQYRRVYDERNGWITLSGRSIDTYQS